MTDDKDLKNLYKYIKKQKFNLSKLTFMHCVVVILWRMYMQI